MRRLSSRFVTSLFAIAIPALGAAGCNSDTTTPTTTTTTTTTPVQIVEAFSGTLAVNGAANFNFAATASGGVTAFLKTMTPATTGIVGLALGTWNGSVCQVVVANDAATPSITVTAAATAAGNLCVRIYDVGKFTAAQTFEITITHF